MAGIEMTLPALSRNALGSRIKRQTKALGVMKMTEPAQIALRLRRIARELGKAAEDEASPVADRVAAAKAMMDAQAQLLDVIGWPKRPASPALKPGHLPPPVDITPAPDPGPAPESPGASPESGI